MNAVNQCQCVICRHKLDHPDRQLHEHVNLLMNCLNEQQRRWMAAMLSEMHGVNMARLITGLSRNTVLRGRQELRHHLKPLGEGVEAFQASLTARPIFGKSRRPTPETGVEQGSGKQVPGKRV